jgi:1-hydroxycarotenoid 3,4-desaturase
LQRTAPKVIVVGAGVGGLAAAVDLARRGADVLVLERASAPGGKMREVAVGNTQIDGGPTVFTMRWIFEQLFADAGGSLDSALDLHPVETLARHAWTTGGTLDLFASVDASADAIGQFAGAAEARGFREFCTRSAAIYQTLRDSFIAAQQPSPLSLVSRVGWTNLGALWQTAPMQRLWPALARHFREPRLQQLFGRYATYCGSSPFAAPATLMLVAHVEQDGVWVVAGGMRRVADALQALGERHGARYRYESTVAEIVSQRGRVTGVTLASGEHHDADIVVFNGDVSALSSGLLGTSVQTAAQGVARANRSLSAVTWCAVAHTRGFALDHHNVFFSPDYAREFHKIFVDRNITELPTVYVCAQDRGPGRARPTDSSERLLLLINAPADGDVGFGGASSLDEYAQRAQDVMNACGLSVALDPARTVATSPMGFDGLFPGTGGALYGRANHGPFASFARHGARSKLAGLYLAGGSVHPGPGIPMAAMSGRLAAAAAWDDLVSR